MTAICGDFAHFRRKIVHCIEINVMITTVLFERNYYVTEKSEAIACARRCRSSQLAGWWIPHE
jgi:hypothetical protein